LAVLLLVESPSLLLPAIPPDSFLEVEIFTDCPYLRRSPFGNLPIGVDARIMEAPANHLSHPL